MSQPTVLIVDDSPENLTLLGEALHKHYKVRAASSGARALQLARELPTPDLVLLDVMMPDMNGYEVLERLRESAATRDTPVIFSTAMNATEDEQRGLLLGAADYLTKPLRPAIVLARVRTQLQLRSAHDELRRINASLETEVSRRVNENVAIQDITLRALARLAETRDNETGNHILRTREYVRLLGRRLQSHPDFAPTLDDETVALMAKSAPLHDIGKVGIPDHILLKPGRLTTAEWKIMKTHAKLGADAIARAESDTMRSVPFLTFAKQVAHSHHERWDGDGYPEGLAGDAIPLVARLMAVADVFDALISRRVYKEAIAPGEAMAMIVADSGKHFDPRVVDAFIDCFQRFCEVASEYRDDADDDPDNVLTEFAAPSRAMLDGQFA